MAYLDMKQSHFLADHLYFTTPSSEDGHGAPPETIKQEHDTHHIIPAVNIPCDVTMNKDTNIDHLDDDATPTEQVPNYIIISVEEDPMKKKKLPPDKETGRVISQRSAENSSKKVSCEECGKILAHQGSLKTHMLLHSGEKPFVCEICQHRSTTNTNHKSHLLTHLSTKPFSCDVCQSGFLRESQLKSHKQNKHSETEPVKRVKKKGRVHICDVCGKELRSPGELTTHMRIHTGDKAFVCKFCNQGFNVACNYRRHLLRHTSNWLYGCQFCHKGYYEKRHLLGHMTKLHQSEITRLNKPVKDLVIKLPAHVDSQASNDSSGEELVAPSGEELVAPSHEELVTIEGTENPSLTIILAQPDDRQLNSSQPNIPKVQVCDHKLNNDNNYKQIKSHGDEPVVLPRGRSRDEESSSSSGGNPPCEAPMASIPDDHLGVKQGKVHGYQQIILSVEGSEDSAIDSAVGDKNDTSPAKDPDSGFSRTAISESSSGVKSGDHVISRLEEGEVPLHIIEASTIETKNELLGNSSSATATDEKSEGKSPPPFIDQRRVDWVCSVCEKCFRTKTLLRLHEKMHASARPHACNICEKLFKTKAVLSSHMLCHSRGARYECQECGRDFKQYQGYWRHLRYHKNDKKYVCYVCQKAFVVRSDLTRHERIHAATRTLQCVTCSRHFTTSDSLTKHKQLCQAVVWFCEQCQHSFSDFQALMSHPCQQNNDPEGTSKTNHSVGGESHSPLCRPHMNGHCDVLRQDHNVTSDVPRHNHNVTSDVPRQDHNVANDVPRQDYNVTNDVPRQDHNVTNDVPRDDHNVTSKCSHNVTKDTSSHDAPHDKIDPNSPTRDMDLNPRIEPGSCTVDTSIWRLSYQKHTAQYKAEQTSTTITSVDSDNFQGNSPPQTSDKTVFQTLEQNKNDHIATPPISAKESDGLSYVNQEGDSPNRLILVTGEGNEYHIVNQLDIDDADQHNVVELDTDLMKQLEELQKQGLVPDIILLKDS